MAAPLLELATQQRDTAMTAEAALLNELADTDQSSLTANLDAAELAYADGMRAEDNTARTQRFLKEEIAAREASAAFERNAAGRRRFQATRGDS